MWGRNRANTKMKAAIEPCITANTGHEGKKSDVFLINKTHIKFTHENWADISASAIYCNTSITSLIKTAMRVTNEKVHLNEGRESFLPIWTQTHGTCLIIGQISNIYLCSNKWSVKQLTEKHFSVLCHWIYNTVECESLVTPLKTAYFIYLKKIIFIFLDFLVYGEKGTILSGNTKT